MYAQIVDDTKGKVLFGVSSLASKDLKAKKKIEIAKEIGKRIGEIAIEKGIKEVAFDRTGYKYHGRVRAVAEGAREVGLKF